jgi:hypothetical protein
LLTFAAAACGDDDDDTGAAAIAEVEDVARTTFESDDSNADYFFAHATDNIIETVFFTTREECMASAVECIGEPASILSISGTVIDGDAASTNVLSDLGPFRLDLVREDGTWKVDALLADSDEVPEGAAVVDLTLAEFSFEFDPRQIPAGGNFAFRTGNVGAQTHEVVLVGIPDGATLEEALEPVFAEEVPPIALKVFIRPGQEDVDIAFAEPLAPGKYALVCFFPDTDDPEFLPHIEKGMIATFIVGG